MNHHEQVQGEWESRKGVKRELDQARKALRSARDDLVYFLCFYRNGLWPFSFDFVFICTGLATGQSKKIWPPTSPGDSPSAERADHMGLREVEGTKISSLWGSAGR